MRKLYSMVFSMILLMGLAFSAIAQDSSDTAAKLTTGKWVNHEDGYVPNPIGISDKTVKRYKTFEFKGDHTFIMDSVKQRFSGSWKTEGENVIIIFKPKTVTHLFKNSDPNSGSNAYSTTKEVLNLGTRIAKVDGDMLKFANPLLNCAHESDAVVGLKNFYEFTGFANVTPGHLLMMLIGIFFIFLAIKYDYEPLLLIPIGTGILIGNIPMFQAVDFNLKLGVYEPGSVMNLLYSGVLQGWYPPLIFLGIGAMTDFSSLISNPRLMILGAAAQIGIFATFLGALWMGFAPPEAGAIGIIGGADGPTAIFLSSKLANGMNVMANGETVKNLIGPIAIAAYSYMALVPVIQPPIINLLTTKKERKIKMKAPRAVTRLEKIMFPIIGLLLTAYISPTSVPLLGMLFFGNLLKESTVTNRLAETASNALINIITILLGVTVGASTQADVFLTADSILIFGLGAASFIVATAGGVIFAKVMNIFSPKDRPINPMIGAAGVSAVPDSARVVQVMGLENDPTNHLLMHAMAPNVSGVIGSAVGAGILLSFLM
ncbi:sodium ion-translocating decarboxylase subunit beta [Labilibaculum sp. DW002]|uniref:Sodium ion-translocating decarboxylase subunit beta n=1 Tax=Paralabilibaculum antarcticum TaxID=2912572 RepID=A0ABT5VQV5_9BACT|nr:sodium ion-translocating decarboxylase subunit beta [Labilibaculum sp. DW002]MDE5417677.1 sodium ion-translocating decarboxylase subunit beta [Labilibaculum sp. DW002]